MSKVSNVGELSRFCDLLFGGNFCFLDLEEDLPKDVHPNVKVVSVAGEPYASAEFAVSIDDNGSVHIYNKRGNFYCLQSWIRKHSEVGSSWSGIQPVAGSRYVNRYEIIGEIIPIIRANFF